MDHVIHNLAQILSADPIMWVLLLILIASLVRVFKGPSIWDRLLGMNLIAVKIIIIITVFASERDLAYLLDFAIIYALFGFIGTIFMAQFFSKRNKNGGED